MAAKPVEGKRRFAPIPIETTFEQYRKPVGPNQAAPGPAGEPTPEPSPRSTSPARSLLSFDAQQYAAWKEMEEKKEREKRRFAPQLIDSSRRSRRAGDVGPATRPVDKTDITPYTNHIYSVQRTRKRHHKITGLARRESCDEETADHVYNLAKREIEKRLQEVAMSAFPNSGIRIGGAEHFVVREGSEDDDLDAMMMSDDSSSSSSSSADAGGNKLHVERRQPSTHHDQQFKRGRPQVRTAAAAAGRRSRRESSEEDISWHVKEAQDAAERRARSRMDTQDLDDLELEMPANDGMALTSIRQTTPSPSPYTPGPIGESLMPLISGPSNLLAPIGESTMPLIPSAPPVEPIGETFMPFIPSAPAGKAGVMPYIPAETGFQRHGGGGRGGLGGFGGANSPFATPGLGALAMRRNISAERRKNNNSPPMLGSDLVFRRCPSPKQTKLEPDHLWKDGAEDANRDPTEQKGLWRGYCYTAVDTTGAAAESLAPSARPLLISTPMIPSSAHTDPFSDAFLGQSGSPATSSGRGSVASGGSGGLSEEPTPLHTPRPLPHPHHLAVPELPQHHTGFRSAGAPTLLHPLHGGLPLSNTSSAIAASVSVGVGGGHGHHGLGAKRVAASEAKGGIHMLVGLEERLRKEKAAADLEEQVQAEFTDRFVTQVYNYLSLGYPAMAWSYDDELSKISRIPVSDLRRDDDAVMDGVIDKKLDSLCISGGGVNGTTAGDKSKKSSGVAKKGKANGHIKLTEDDETREEDRCPRWKALKLYIHEWARQHPDLDSISPLAWGVRERRGSWGI